MDAKEVIKAKDLLAECPGHSSVAPGDNKDFKIEHTAPDGTVREFTRKSEVMEYVKNTPSLTEQRQQAADKRKPPNGEPTAAERERLNDDGGPPVEGVADGYDDGDPEARTTQPAKP